MGQGLSRGISLQITPSLSYFCEKGGIKRSQSIPPESAREAGAPQCLPMAHPTHLDGLLGHLLCVTLGNGSDWIIPTDPTLTIPRSCFQAKAAQDGPPACRSREKTAIEAVSTALSGPSPHLPDGGRGPGSALTPGPLRVPRTPRAVPGSPGGTHVSELGQAALAHLAEALVGRAALQEELRQAHGLAAEQRAHGGGRPGLRGCRRGGISAAGGRSAARGRPWRGGAERSGHGSRFRGGERADNAAPTGGGPARARALPAEVPGTAALAAAERGKCRPERTSQNDRKC